MIKFSSLAVNQIAYESLLENYSLPANPWAEALISTLCCQGPMLEVGVNPIPHHKSSLRIPHSGLVERAKSTKTCIRTSGAFPK